MTKEDYIKLDNDIKIVCNDCGKILHKEYFSCKNILKNLTGRCCTCDWIKRHNGIPFIEGFTKDQIHKALEFILYNKSAYINDLAKYLNIDLDDSMELFRRLKIGNRKMRILSNCDYCGRQIEDFLSTNKINSHNYCSRECYWKHKKIIIGKGKNNKQYNRIKVLCTNCGKEMEIIPYDYNKVNSKGDNHNFCSQECYWEFRKKYYVGENGAMYNYKFSDEQKEHSRTKLLERLKKDNRLETGIQLKVNSILDDLNIKYEREKVFDYYAVDNYLPTYNGIIEVMGDYWHVSPLCYNEKKYSMNEMQQKQLHRDKLKYSFITNHYNIPILYLLETDINNNPELCIKLIYKYINDNKSLENYHSFNWQLENNNLYIRKEIIIPYQNMSVNDYRHLIKKKVG